jgi:hypothetical protein
MKRTLAFDDKEGAILNVLYEIGSGTHTSYTLARHLNPTVQMSTPAAGVAFSETRSATERLIARGLVRGERFSGADGVYFNELKLTPKGERTAIQHRQASQGIRAVEEAVEEVEAILEEPKKLEDKK